MELILVSSTLSRSMAGALEDVLVRRGRSMWGRRSPPSISVQRFPSGKRGARAA